MALSISTPDDALLDAADRVLMTEGPSGFTLAKATASAGVCAATFVKRFGSKEQLFLRLSQRWATSLDGELDQAAEGVDSPLQRLRIVALYSYHDIDNPLTASKQLAALAVDLQNDEMRGWLHVGWGHVRRHLERHTAAAADAGQLTGAPPAGPAGPRRDGCHGGRLPGLVGTPRRVINPPARSRPRRTAVRMDLIEGDDS